MPLDASEIEMSELNDEKTGDLKAIQEEDLDDGPLPPTPPTRLKSPTDKDLNDETNLHLIQREKTQIGKGLLGAAASSNALQLNSYR